MSDFTQIRQRLTRAVAEAEKGMMNLTIFSAEEQVKQKPAVLAHLQSEVDYAIELAQEAEAEAHTLELESHVDPLAILSTDELQRMSAASDFVREDLAALTPGDLTRRLLAVSRGTDRASQMLHLRYATSVAFATGDSNVYGALVTLDEILYGAQRTKAEKAVARAQAIRKEAAQLKFDASQALADLDGSQAIADAQRLARYSF